MNILFFTDHFRPEPSAPAAHVYERAITWVKWGHRVTVICSAPNFPDGKVYRGYKNRWRYIENMDGVRVIRIKTLIARNEGFLLRILDYMSYMFSAFFFALFEEKPDIVISTSPHLFVPIAGVACAKVKRTPHVFELRDLWPASIRAVSTMKPGIIYKLFERLEMFLYNCSTRILSLTHSFADSLISRGVRSDKIDVVISGANLDLFFPRPKDRDIEKEYCLEGRFVVGYLGTIGLAHGLGNVLNAAEILRDSNVIFFLVGVGAAKSELIEAARNRKLENVVFASRQLREEMPKYWSVCNASLIHLRDDRLFEKVIPSKIFESMAMGIPIIYCAPTGEASAIVLQHDAGVWIPPGDPKRLADTILSLRGDPGLCAKLAANSNLAASNYSRDCQSRNTLSVLEKAMRPNHV